MTQREQIAESAARQEEQVRQQKPDAVEAPVPVFQAEDALGENERSLEDCPVVAVGGIVQLLEGALAIPREVVERRVSDRALRLYVHPGGDVVVERERAREQEERACGHERPVAAQAAGDALGRNALAQSSGRGRVYQRRYSGGANSTPQRSPDAPCWPVRMLAMG